MDARLAEALTSLHSGRPDLAFAQLSQITTTDPVNAEAYSLLATACVRTQRLAEAQRAIQRAIELTPENADFYLTAANIEQDLGNLEASADLLRQALRLRPGFAQAHNNLGIVLSDLGRIEDASNAFSEAIRLNPQYARAHANLAAAQLRLLQLVDALQSAQRALTLQPQNAEAHHLVGAALKLLGETDAAEVAFGHALRLRPNFVESSLLLASLLGQQKRQEDAERITRNALALSPARADLWSMLGDLVNDRDDLAGALEAYQRSLELRPNHLKTTIRAALLLPNIYMSEAHLIASRERYALGVEYLLANVETLSAEITGERFEDTTPVNFLLAYQGCDDKILQRRYGEFVRHLALRAKPGQTAELPRQSASNRRIRVGFCSRFFFRSTVGNYFSSWITDLDRGVFEVFVYHSEVIVDDVSRRLQDSADHYVQNAGSTTFFSQRIADDRLDILVYPELGMDPMYTQLAALRLAPIQACAWGHPVTPGHPMIDYYISCAAMEPANAQQHYNERLLTLPGIGTRYDMPTMSSDVSGKTRADYQLPEDAHLYFFPQSLFKVHPANDRLLVTAIANDPKGVLVMFAGQNGGVTQKFVARLSAVFAEQGIAPQGRVKMLPYLTHDDYKRINALCDVMLDTLHWSGGNTSLDALAMGLPIVTLPGEFMRGRQTMGMLTLLGVDELIATSTDDYLAIAKRVATDQEYRKEMSQKILANLGQLFDDAAPPKALGELLRSLVVENGDAHSHVAPPSRQ